MKVLSVRVAKTIWLVPLIDLNPRGRFLVPAAAALAQRYGFTKSPDATALTTDPPKYTFELGVFESPSAGPTALNLTIHADGLVVENRASTIVGDEFLVDALDWLATSFGLPRASSLSIQKLYSSELYLSFSKPIQLFSDKMQAFHSYIKTNSGLARSNSMDLVQLNFGSDPKQGPQVNLRIEREINSPFEAGRYFSFAAIGTERHLEILARFEEAAC